MNCESVNVCLKALICIFVQVQASENNFFNFLIWWKSRFPPKGFSYIDQMRHFLKQFSSLEPNSYKFGLTSLVEWRISSANLFS